MLFKSAYKKAGPAQVGVKPSPDNPVLLNLYIGASSNAIELCQYGIASSKITNLADRQPQSVGEQAVLLDGLIRDIAGTDERVYSRIMNRSSVTIGGEQYSLGSVVDSAMQETLYHDVHTELVAVAEATTGKPVVDQGVEAALKTHALRMITHTGSMETLYQMIHNPMIAERFAAFADTGLSVIHYTGESIPSGTGVVGFGRTGVKTMFLGAGTHSPVGFSKAVAVLAAPAMTVNAPAMSEDIAAFRAGDALFNALPMLNELKKQTGVRFSADEENHIVNSVDIKNCFEIRRRLDGLGRDVSEEQYESAARKAVVEVGRLIMANNERVADAAREVSNDVSPGF